MLINKLQNTKKYCFNESVATFTTETALCHYFFCRQKKKKKEEIPAKDRIFGYFIKLFLRQRRNDSKKYCIRNENCKEKKVWETYD